MAAAAAAAELSVDDLGSCILSHGDQASLPETTALGVTRFRRVDFVGSGGIVARDCGGGRRRDWTALGWTALGWGWAGLRRQERHRCGRDGQLPTMITMLEGDGRSEAGNEIYDRAQMGNGVSR